ncbi:hypothetical protein [Paenibacillus sp. R14(2021)]|uniref:hypothetical protein n=1 Tax=Paenibacillus sp. R14(2021) TaxID=2859228 RepID=UPI001C615002|nr:hypothetical protein [Paenibacillus sp. R14(2021)]
MFIRSQDGTAIYFTKSLTIAETSSGRWAILADGNEVGRFSNRSVALREMDKIYKHIDEKGYSIYDLENSSYE